MPNPGHFNIFNFNAGRFNAGAITTSLATDLVVFDGYSLNNGTTITVSAIHDSGPSRRIIGRNKTRTDGMYFNAAYWTRKIVIVEGHIVADTQSELDSLMDTMRKRLRVSEGNLDLNYDSGSRRYVASLADGSVLFPQREHYHINWIPFTAKFECRTPFATDKSYTNSTEESSALTYNVVLSNDGTVEGAPIFILVFSAASSVTAVNIKNTENDDEIEYSGSISATDTLEFNSEDRFVKLNSAEVDYSGSFPESKISGNSYQITVTGTSYTASITVKRRNRYL